MTRERTPELGRRSPAQDILLTVLLAFAILLGISLYLPGRAGVIGEGLDTLTSGLLGPVALALPVLLVVITVTLLVKRKPLPPGDIWLHVALTLATLAALIQVLTIPYEWFYTAVATPLASDPPVGAESTATDSLKLLWLSGSDPTAHGFVPGQYPGGLMGGMTALGLTRLFGRLGGALILVTGLIIEAALIFNFSISWLFERTGRVMVHAGRSLRETGRIAAEHLGSGTHTLAQRTYTEPNKQWNHAIGHETAPAEPEDPSTVAVGRGSKRKVLTYGDTPDHAPEHPRRARFFDVPEVASPDFYGDEVSSDTSGVQEADAPQAQVPLRTGKGRRPTPPDDDWGDALDADVLAHQGVDAALDDTAERAPDLKIDTFGHSEDSEAPAPRKRVSASVERVKHEQAGHSYIDTSESDEPESRPYQLPPLELLQPRGTGQGMTPDRAQRLGEKLEQTLASFGVEARVIHITSGPTITRFELTPGSGVKVSRIVNLSDDIALSLAAVGVRIEAPIPGKSAIGIEIPNKETAIVGLRQLLEEERRQPHAQRLMVALGRDIPGTPIYSDLAKMPHLLIAGATGSGKSICINVILLNILYRAKPDEVKLLLVDPKVVELSIYNGIPHLLAPVVTDPKKAANTLNWAVAEMTRRYGLFAAQKVRDLNTYNLRAASNGEEVLPLIVLVIDELSDLMVTAAREVEEAIARLTAMARAAGIHLIIATQRPSVDVITGVIKANMPSRIAFAVTSQVDSRTILDQGGAEKLLGKGDMLYYPQSSSKPIRGQGAFVSEEEVEEVVSFIRAQEMQGFDQEVAQQIVSTTPSGKTEDEVADALDEEEDDLLGDAIEIVIDAGYASVSILQRRLQVGYPRAARLIDRLEQLGHIGPFEGSKPRKVIITRMEWELKKQGGSDERDEAPPVTAEDLPFDLDD